MKTGVYRLFNTINNKSYIGSASDLMNRKSNHFQRLRKNNHYNSFLQESYNKDGEENFKFEILHICSKSELISLEQYYLDKYESKFNICKTAGTTLGVKPSEITKEKQRLKKLGSKRTEETKNKMRQARKNQVFSEETRQKMSESAKKRDLSIAIKNVSGYQKDGELNPRATLTNEQVYNIRLDYVNGMTRKELVIKYNSKPWRINWIVTYKTFKNVAIVNVG